jgi:hypothetical protein
LRLRSHDVELWVYDDAVAYSVRGTGGGFELASYGDGEQLIAALLGRLEELL